eukprot:Nk52_evm54s2192 gene=Nk52_evmTU54s2192
MSSEEPPRTILFVFIGFVVGALIRHVFKKSPFPYTVMLIVIGLSVGLITSSDEGFAKYTSATNMDPHLMLYIFLPTLIFESSFAVDLHIFKKTAGQVLILAVPGLLICVFLTALLAKYIFTYDWSWLESLMFGSIVSATDPVAVVALLKDLGASKVLGTAIEGESLLNDGAAIVVFQVFLDGSKGDELTPLGIFLYFIRVALGGPAFGYACGKFSTIWLSHVYNDALVEITITVCMAYMAYFVGEAGLGVSGVLSVVALGLTINSERTNISPEVEHFLHSFWEMMAYLANTLIFLIVGIIISEKAFKDISGIDVMYLFALYFGVNVIRVLAISSLYPILKRLGYGLTWQFILLMTWGGLRGAVGLALAIVVAEDPGINFDTVGSKVIFHTAGIVLLTLIINASTMKYLLMMLGMSDISDAKRLMMANAVKHIKEAQTSTIEILKTDRFLSDSDWNYVEKNVEMIDPYYRPDKHKEEDNTITAEALRAIRTCPHCKHRIPHIYSANELAELAEDARGRFLKAEKISFWKQYEEGILGREAVVTLIAATDTTLDIPDKMLDCDDIRIHWEVPTFYDRAINWIEAKISEIRVVKYIPKPDSPYLMAFYKVSINSIFEWTIFFVITVNLVFIIIELETDEDEDNGISTLEIFNIVFCGIYFVEAAIKILGLRKYYFKSWWNIFDFVILLVSIMDVILDFVVTSTSFSPSILRLARIFRVFRVGRVLRLVRAMFPLMRDWVNEKINEKLFFGFDVGIAYVVAQEEVEKLMSHICKHEAIRVALLQRSEKSKLEVLKELGLLRKKHPGIAISVKTRQALRSVLNHGMSSLHGIHGDGLLDESDAHSIEALIEKNKKKITSMSTYVNEPEPEEMVRSVKWLNTSPLDIQEYIIENATLMEMEEEEVVVNQGDESDFILVLLTGLLKVSAKFKNKIVHEDYLGPGAVVGELGILTRSSRTATVFAATSGTFYKIPAEALYTAIERYPTLEVALWRVASIRIAYMKLRDSVHSNWGNNKLKLYCEGGEVHTFQKGQQFTAEEGSDVILVKGSLQCSHTGDRFYASSIIPPNVVKATFLEPGNLFVVGDLNGVTTAQIAFPDGRKDTSSVMVDPATSTEIARSIAEKLNVSYGHDEELEEKSKNLSVEDRSNSQNDNMEERSINVSMENGSHGREDNVEEKSINASLGNGSHRQSEGLEEKSINASMELTGGDESNEAGEVEIAIEDFEDNNEH